MARLRKISVAGLLATALGLAVAACQSYEMSPPAAQTAASADTMSVADVSQLIVGNTVFVRDENRKVSRAEYFSPDGAVHLKAKPDGFGMTFSYQGTHYFNDREELCTNYPTLPISPKEFCVYIVPSDDGRHELTDGGVYERILEGEQLSEFK